MSSPSDSLRPGDRLHERYEIVRLVGRGGMGEVYAALNLATGRRVALKTIRSAFVDDHRRARFLREARATTAIEHPNVVQVLDVFEHDDMPVMVMELLEGETLAALITREGRLSLGRAAALLSPIARALQAAHDKGIVHRDLKPENIFLTIDRDGKTVPKIVDFGIAKVVSGDTPSPLLTSDDTGETATGVIIGTPRYMSMEQAMAVKDIDHRTDIWSFGVIAYELLVGRRPIQFDNLGQLFVAFLKGDAPSIRTAGIALPEAVVRAVDRCLERERDRRLADLREVIATLELHADANASGPAVTHAPPTIVPVTTTLAHMSTIAAIPVAQPSWWRRAAIAFVLIAVIASLAWSFRSRSDRPMAALTPAFGSAQSFAPPTHTSEPAPPPPVHSAAQSGPTARASDSLRDATVRRPSVVASALASTSARAIDTPPTIASARRRGIVETAPY
jgi:serine/threonine-protein kinase